jgi:hypothetical protein
MLRAPWSCGVAVIVALTVSHPAAAQAPAPSPAAAAATKPSLAPTLAATRLSFSREGDARLTMNAAAARMSPNDGKAAAIVGGAAVLIGLVAGGDGGTVLVVSGVGLGLFGLYVWQRGD